MRIARAALLEGAIWAGAWAHAQTSSGGSPGRPEDPASPVHPRRLGTPGEIA